MSYIGEQRMNSNPAVSVVIPLLNKASHISRALDSVFAQTVQDFEIIVVEGGSTDNSPEIVRGFRDPRIRLILQDKKRPGVSAARNIGIHESRSEFIAFLDADDEWRPRFLETIIRLRQRFPDAGLYATSYCLGYRSHMVHPKVQGIPSSPWEGVLDSYFKVVVVSPVLPFVTSSVGISKTTLADVGLFNPDLRRGEDAELFCRVAIHSPIVYSTYAGAVYHQISENKATRNFIRFESLLKKYLSQTPLEELKSLPAYDDFCKYSEKCCLASAYQNIGAGELKFALEDLSRVKSRMFLSQKLILLMLAKLPFFLGKHIVILRLHLINSYYSLLSSVENLQRG
jgi:glycosyltransferase involved in cell wall biosynthesis